MKIAQVVCVIPPYGGGLGAVAEQFSNELIDLGHDVTVFIPDFEKIAVVEKKYTVKRIKPLIRIGLGAFLPQLLWKIRGFDVIHLHFPFFGGSVQTALAKIFNKNSKLIVTYHQDLKLKSWMNWYYRIYLKTCWPIIFKLADKIQVSSFDYLEGSLIKKYFLKKPEKFFELNFGANKRFFPTKKDENLLNKYELSKDAKIVMFVGGLDSAHYFKGIEVLIDSFTKIPDLQICAMVIGKGNLSEKYKKQVIELGFEKRFIFTGFIDNDNLNQYYNLSDLVVLPSINSNEAFGLILAEAMACAKPVIASNLRGVRTVLQNNENGYLVEPNNADDLAEKIKKILLNEDLYQRFSEKSLQIARDKFDWKIIVKKLEKLYY